MQNWLQSCFGCGEILVLNVHLHPASDIYVALPLLLEQSVFSPRVPKKCFPATNFHRVSSHHALFPCSLTAAVQSKHRRVSHPVFICRNYMYQFLGSELSTRQTSVVCDSALSFVRWRDDCGAAYGDHVRRLLGRTGVSGGQGVGHVGRSTVQLFPSLHVSRVTSFTGGAPCSMWYEKTRK